LIDLGSIALANVSITAAVLIFVPLRFCTIFLASITPTHFSASTNSAESISARSRSLITPLQEFNVLCGVTLTGTIANVVCFNRFVACAGRDTSMRRTPLRSFLISTTSHSPFMDFSMTNGDNFELLTDQSLPQMRFGSNKQTCSVQL